MDNSHKLLIAIDFGTTFSGAAFAFPNQDPEVRPILLWPSSERGIKATDKAPTELRYPRGGDPEWGFLIPPDAHDDEILRLIKLGLESSQVPEGSEAARTVTALRAVHDVDQLIQHYLSGLLGHVMTAARETMTDNVETYATDFILTVPAIWSERSTQRTIRALQGARGFPPNATVSVLSEPEAAAIYTFEKIERHGLNIGDTFVVVDAGGGTVDLITYTLNSLQPTLEVTEAAPGSGGMCGSQFLNSRFLQFLDAKLGKAEGYDSFGRKEALERFERDTKRKFVTAAIPHEVYRIPVAGLVPNKDLGITGSAYIMMTASELHAIFEPIVLQVIKLVREQIITSNAPVRKIMLIGGFGQSIYLKERIQAASYPGIQGTLEVLQPEHACRAVVDGAVLKGLSMHMPGKVAHVRIKARAARKHYGTEVGVPYREELHSSIYNKRWYDGLDGIWRVDVLDWFITRGEIVSEKVAFLKNFSCMQRVAYGPPQKIWSQVYADDQSIDAPLARNKDVKVLCTLEADLSSIPLEDLDRRKGQDGAMYYVVDYQIESIYSAVSTSYTLIHKGERYRTVTEEYV